MIISSFFKNAQYLRVLGFFMSKEGEVSPPAVVCV